MESSNIINPPEVGIIPKRGGFWKQLGMLVLGTTVSLVLTFGTAQLIEKGQRTKDRRLTALMVMSNIEAFAQQLDSIYVQMDEADSASTWLLTRPEEKLALMPGDQLVAIINTAFIQDLITYDKSTENIFSNNIDTWKNLGNFQFIDNVGKCFSTMRLCEEMWNGNLDDIKTTTEEVARRNANSPNKIELNLALMHDSAFRRLLQRQHKWRNWLRCSAEELRYYNRQNMAAIGITEQEVLDFLKARQREINAGVEPPDDEALSVPRPDSRSLTTYSKYDSLIYGTKTKE
ncbi:MAG: hypothetical protein J5848_00115 [Bacteroidales bacterium]|nr:hypothetical protein [Bacteroidales bacterium]